MCTICASHVVRHAVGLSFVFIVENATCQRTYVLSKIQQARQYANTTGDYAIVYAAKKKGYVTAVHLCAFMIFARPVVKFVAGLRSVLNVKKEMSKDIYATDCIIV